MSMEAATDNAQRETPLMLSQLIDQLSPPPEPSPVPWLPQTWGWAVLTTILTLVLLWFVLHHWKRWRSNTYRREALRELDRRLAQGEGLAAVADILRRTALAAWPRDQVAALRGEAWVAFLDRHFPTSRYGRFSGPLGIALINAPYRPGHDSEALDQLANLTRHWIRHHTTNRQPSAIDNHKPSPATIRSSAND